MSYKSPRRDQAAGSWTSSSYTTKRGSHYSQSGKRLYNGGRLNHSRRGFLNFFLPMSEMLRGRGLTRGGAFVDFLLVVVLLMLGYVFIVRRGYMGGVDEVLGGHVPTVGGAAHIAAARKAHRDPHNIGEGHFEAAQENAAHGGPVNKVTHEELQHLVDVRVKKVPEARPRDCRDIEHDVKRDKVTVVVDFYDYQSYDLKTTIGSLVQNTPDELLHEIIVVDDGSTLDYIVKDTEKFVALYPRTRLVHNKARLGQMKARAAGLKLATSSIVAFVDTSVICNQGWLEPLLALIRQERNVIAVPHYDSIQDPVSYEYKKTPDQLVSTFSWSLAVRMSESDEPLTVTSSIASNVLRGNVFVVHVDLLTKIAGLDTSFEGDGGEYLELSLRTWMCGGAIRVVPCSRVGIQNLHDPVKINSPKNVRRIAELWLSERKDLVYKYTGVSPKMDARETEALGKRQTMLQALQCKNMKWYMENVAKDVPTPSVAAVHYGMLRCKTGRCARIGADKRLDLGTCSHQKYNVMRGDLLFEMDTEGRVKVNGQCLAVKESAYILAEPCKENDTQQKWTYEADHVLRNVWSGFCAMHVTDPDKKTTDGTRQIAMAQDCKKTDEFATWEFGTP